MTWARIIDAAGVPTVAEVISTDPATLFTPEIAAMFSAATPEMVYRAEFRDGAWVPPPEPDPIPDPVPVEPTPPARRKKLTAPEFKLQFQQSERISIRLARAYSGSDPASLGLKLALDDFYEILDDPRLSTVDLELASTIEGVGALVGAGILTEERAGEILSGVAD